MYDNFMSYLYKEFQKHLIEISKPELNNLPPKVEDFIDWARDYLSHNMPTTVRYMPVGFGVQLQQGQVLVFTSDEQSKMLMRDEGVPITYMTRGKVPTDVMPDTSVAITGK
jgi:hypothetical protein